MWTFAVWSRKTGLCRHLRDRGNETAVQVRRWVVCELQLRVSTCLVLLLLARFNTVCGPFEHFLHAGAMKCATWGEWSKSNNRNMMWIMIAQLKWTSRFMLICSPSDPAALFGLHVLLSMFYRAYHLTGRFVALRASPCRPGERLCAGEMDFVALKSTGPFREGSDGMWLRFCHYPWIL